MKLKWGNSNRHDKQIPEETTYKIYIGILILLAVMLIIRNIGLIL